MKVRSKEIIVMLTTISLITACPLSVMAAGGVPPGGFPGSDSSQSQVVYASSPGEIVTGITTSSASSLTADYDNATVIEMSDDNSTVKIKSSGTYIVTGECSEGSITVTKGTTGVVLILRDLTLTSSSCAPLSLNKTSEVMVVVDGTVTLTDNEDIANEESDDFDGAAIKAKSGSSVYITGSGTLNIIGNTKNGIKIGDSDDGEPSFVIDGPVINIVASNDGINSGYDLAILSGSVNISAGDDGLHADRILTVDGAVVTVTDSTEAVEGTVVNLFSGTGTFTASDDGINAANSDGTYADLGYSVNITGGEWTVNAGSDGIDSNGNVNITGGVLTIQNSSSIGGDAGIDYDGSIYVSDTATVNNNFGVAGPDGGGMNAPSEPINGWKLINDIWYYYVDSTALIGWQKINGHWYYMNSSGAMQTGWLNQDGKWYYLKTSGAMATGWQLIGSTWYYFNGSGSMQTGWKYIKSSWYYFRASGAMATGWVKWRGDWYYLSSSGAMVTGELTVNGVVYTFDSNGVCTNP